MEGLYINNGGGQGYGFILYRKHVGAVKTLQFSDRVRDRAIVSSYSLSFYVSNCFPSPIINVQQKKKNMLCCILCLYSGYIADFCRCFQQILLNGKEVEVVDWLETDHVIRLDAGDGKNQLDILVENCGRVNYADFDSPLLNNQHKGLSP